MRAAIPFQPGLEHATPGEAETQEGLFLTVEKIEKITHRARAHASRGIHAKSVGLLRATMKVRDGLPKSLAQGIFAKPAEYAATIRISTIPGDILSDAVSVPRGFALKVLDVPGKLLPDAKGIAAQDFLFASGRSFSAPTAHRFLKILRLLSYTTERVDWLKVALSRIMRSIQRILSQMGYPKEMLGILGGHPPTNPLGECFFTQAPIRYGDYVAKLGIFPEAARFKALADIEVPVDQYQDALRDAICAVMGKGAGSWTLRVQLRRDENANPIEDASVAWPEEGNPYIPVATITVPKQEGWSEALSRQIDEDLSFSPWQGLEAHQPLGAIMRARRYVYPKAVALRGALNHRRVTNGKRPRRAGTVTATVTEKARIPTIPTKAPVKSAKLQPTRPERSALDVSNKGLPTLRRAKKKVVTRATSTPVKKPSVVPQARPSVTTRQFETAPSSEMSGKQKSSAKTKSFPSRETSKATVASKVSTREGSAKRSASLNKAPSSSVRKRPTASSTPGVKKQATAKKSGQPGGKKPS